MAPLTIASFCRLSFEAYSMNILNNKYACNNNIYRVVADADIGLNLLLRISLFPDDFSWSNRQSHHTLEIG